MGKLKIIEAKDFKELNKKGKIVLIDVSKKEKFNAGSIPNSVNLFYSFFKKNKAYEAIASKTLPNYVTSNTGRLGKKAAKLLLKKGYDVTFIKGGSDAYGKLYPLIRLIKTN